MSKVLDFSEVVESLSKNQGRAFHLLLGNGFSMAYDPSIFSYNALHKFVTDNADESLAKLFAAAGTSNFELVMEHLDRVKPLLSVLEVDPAVGPRIDDLKAKLEASLIDALHFLHPEHVFRIGEDQTRHCATFLRDFLATGGSIFTTNYDLLLYWVLMREQATVKDYGDGFGRDLETSGEYVPDADLEFSELRWGKHRDTARIHYLHGSLPLFDTGAHVVKIEYDGTWLMTQVEERIKAGQYPIFVTAGSSMQKLRAIRQNPYLMHCYEQLRRVTGSVVSLGFGFGPYDEHIIDALNAANAQPKPHRLWSLYIGVYSEDSIAALEPALSKLRMKVHLFDSKSANIWRPL